MKRIKKLLSMWRALGQDRDDPMPEQSGMNDNYMVDFRPDRFGGARTVDVPVVYGHNSIETTVPTDGTTTINVRVDGEPMKTEPVAVAVKPKDVLQELGRIPSNWSLEGLDTKIKMVKQKRELITISSGLQEVLNRMREGASALGYVFRAPRTGNPYSQSGFKTMWGRLMDAALAAGVIEERFTFHDLRAHYTTYYKERFGDLPDMHANPATTAAVYERSGRVRRKAL